MIVACGFDHAAARVVGAELAVKIVTAFLGAVVSAEERHVRRRAEIDKIERTGGA
jgi:ribose 5-phosphate isomerase RpiB